jgi:hypothetical protein
MDNYNKVMEHRSRAYSNRNSMTASAGRENPMIDEIIAGKDKSDAQTLYRRQTIPGVEFGFDDFQMINIIGKGTFGKVFNTPLTQNSYLGILSAKSTHKTAICNEKY